MATVSVCLVTRDDEKYLERSLLPIKDLVDEIIIVDLESKDSTAEIARRFTNKFSVRPFDNDLLSKQKRSGQAGFHGLDTGSRC